MEETALEQVKNQELQPAEDLRRPNKQGQMPHVILSTFPDIPLNQLEIDDILEVNWNGVHTVIRDAIVRVGHEGGLSSSTLRETIRLISLVLRKLDMDDGQLQRLLRSNIGFWKRLRIRWNIRSLGKKRNMLFALRIELAEEVDAKIHAVLLQENVEYKKLQQELSGTKVAIGSTAHELLDDLARLKQLEIRLSSSYTNRDYRQEDLAETKQLKAKLPSIYRFVVKNTGEEVNSPGAAEVSLHQFIGEIDNQIAPIKLMMEAMRDARKQELYDQASAVVR
jgi:hypothetical protein